MGLTFNGQRLVTPAEQPAVAESDLATHLGLIAGDYQPPFLQALISAATSAIERDLRRCLVKQTWRFAFSGSGTSVRLPMAPAIELVSVTIDGTDATANCTLDADAFPPKVEIPETDEDSIVSVVAQMGFGENPTSVPPELTAAVRMLAADLFEHRESQADVQLYENTALKFLLNPWRTLEFA